MNSKLKNIFSESGCPADGVLQKYLNGELSQSQKHDIEKHLIDCEMCSDELEGLRLMNDSERLNTIIEKINNQIDNKTKIRILKPLFSFVRIAAVLLILIIIGSMYVLYKNFNSLKTEKNLSENVEQSEASEQPQKTPSPDDANFTDSIRKQDITTETKKVIAENKSKQISDKELLTKIRSGKKNEAEKLSEIDDVNEESEIQTATGGNSGASSIAYLEATGGIKNVAAQDSDIPKPIMGEKIKEQPASENIADLTVSDEISKSEEKSVSLGNTVSKDKNKSAKIADSKTENENESAPSKSRYSSNYKKSDTTGNAVSTQDSEQDISESTIDEFKKTMNNNLDSILNIAINDYDNDKSNESKLRLELILQYTHFASYQKAQWYYALTLVKLNNRNEAKKMLKTPNHIYLKDAQDKLVEIDN